MVGGNCPIHNIPLSGFRNLVFCIECDKKLEKEKQEPECYGNIDLPNIEEDTLDLELKTVGYIVSLYKIKLGIITLSPSDNIMMKKPDLKGTTGFVYSFYLSDIEYNLTADGKMAYSTGIYQGVNIKEV